MEDLSSLPTWGILAFIAARVAMDIYERIKARSDSSSSGPQQVFVSGDGQGGPAAMQAAIRDLQERQSMIDALASHGRILETHSGLLEKLVDHEGQQTEILKQLTSKVAQLPCRSAAERPTEPTLAQIRTK